MKCVALGELKERARKTAAGQLTRNPGCESGWGSFVSASICKGLRARLGRTPPRSRIIHRTTVVEVRRMGEQLVQIVESLRRNADRLDETAHGHRIHQDMAGQQLVRAVELGIFSNGLWAEI